MADTRKITGKVEYHSFEGGFWGITDAEGNKWHPVNMPEQLKVHGAMITCRISMLNDSVTVSMWGTPVKIVSFTTPAPPQ